MPKGYFFVEIKITDRAAYEAFWPGRSERMPVIRAAGMIVPACTTNGDAGRESLSGAVVRRSTGALANSNLRSCPFCAKVSSEDDAVLMAASWDGARGGVTGARCSRHRHRAVGRPCRVHFRSCLLAFYPAKWRRARDWRVILR
jgi:hypothetical protein